MMSEHLDHGVRNEKRKSAIFQEIMDAAVALIFTISLHQGRREYKYVMNG